MPVSPAERSGAKPSEPMSGQTSTTTAPNFTACHDQVSRDVIDVTRISASKLPSRSVDKSTSTVPCDSEKLTTVKDSQVHSVPMTTGSVGKSSGAAYKAMIRCHDKLVTAISPDVITISGILLAKEFIPSEISSKMLLPNFTPQEKATILVNAVTDKIKIAPKRFDDLIKTFSEQNCTKDIVLSLSSHVSREKDIEQDIGVIVSTDQQYAICEGHTYTAWATLDPEDKIDLEARLLNEAESIGVKFAHLCTKARNSFEERRVSPQVLADTLMGLTLLKIGCIDYTF